ncbi:MAG: protein kinase [Myxococcales bacterium]|nr:protein kinase [Myxococcales bacterium]
MRPLATGGMAQLYLARIAGIGAFERYVVVKVIVPGRAADAMAIKMFLDEARLAASLHHNNIAQVIEVGAENNLHYFVMEYVHGQDLRAILARCGETGRRIPLELGLFIVAAAAAGLQHAHDRKGPDGMPLKIVHRDVSPSNVMIDYDGAVKMVDFGIAKASERSAETQAGTIKGKFAYMSPEQCRGLELDRRSDIFALGIILYETTTQQRAFRADSDFETMQRIVHGRYRKPTSLYPDFPLGLQAIIERALAVDPKARYQHAGELAEAIEQFAVGERLALSSRSMSRFMKELFGEVPEPWIGHRAASAPVLAPPREYTVSDAEARALRSSQAPINMDMDTEADDGLDMDAPTMPVPLTREGRVDEAQLEKNRRRARIDQLVTSPPSAPLAAVPTRVDPPRPVDDGDTERQPKGATTRTAGGAIASAGPVRLTKPVADVASVVLEPQGGAPAERPAPAASKKMPMPIAPATAGKTAAVPVAPAPIAVPRLASTGSTVPPPFASPAAPPAVSPAVVPAAAASLVGKRPDTRQGHFAPPPGATPTADAATGSPAANVTSADIGASTSPAVVPPPPSRPAAPAVSATIPTAQPAASSAPTSSVTDLVLGLPAGMSSEPVHVAALGGQELSELAVQRPATFSADTSSAFAKQLRPSRRSLWLWLAIAAVAVVAVGYAAFGGGGKDQNGRGAIIDAGGALQLPDAALPVDAAIAITPDAQGAVPPVDAPSVDAPVVDTPKTRVVRITSVPKGAQVYVGRKRVGKTPHELTVGVNEAFTVTLKYSRYRDEVVEIAAGETSQHVKLDKRSSSGPGRTTTKPGDPCAFGTPSWNAMACKKSR